MYHKIGIVIPVRNCLDYTRMAVESIQTMHPYQMIVVDDHSDTPTKEWLASRPDIITLTDPPSSTGLAYNWNLGIKAAQKERCTHYLVINNDIVFHPSTIDNMIQRLDSGDVVMVTGYHIGQTGATLEDLPNYIATEELEPETPDFSCFMITERTLACVGWFDENYIGAYYEDFDYHATLLACGERAISLTIAPTYHFGSRTLAENTSIAPRIGQAAAQNCAYFIRKWNEHPFLLMRDLDKFRSESQHSAEDTDREDRRKRIEEVLTQNRFHYHSSDSGSREISFLPDHFIGHGATPQELYWNVREEYGEWLLDILQYGGRTCRLKREGDGIWRGKKENSQTDIQLTLLSEPGQIDRDEVFESNLEKHHDRAQGARPFIVDCFPFDNELELLEIRLEELKEVVDWFILVESSETYSGNRKPYHFDAVKERFSQYNICHIKLDRFPRHLVTAWDREAFTREAISQGFSALSLSQNDVILLSDVNEIPRVEMVRLYAPYVARGEIECCLFGQSLSYYYVNFRAEELWHGTRMIQVGKLSSLNQLRIAPGLVIPNSGWRFSYLGGAKRNQEQIVAAVHTEYHTPAFTDLALINRCLQEGVDLFGHNIKFNVIPIDLTFPHYLVRNQERFSSLIYHNLEFPRTGTLYAQALLQPSDIVEHLPYLYRLATTVEHITELGTRTGQSTRAFLHAAPQRLICYDIEQHPVVATLETAAKEANIDFNFRKQDVLNIDIEETDLLFIDTLHTETQMRGELERHADRARRYLVFHDTESFGQRGETEGERGIWPAIAQFMRQNPHWRLLKHFQNNNGLTVFIRMQ